MRPRQRQAPLCLLAVSLLAAALSGCNDPAAKPLPPEQPEVSVLKTVARPVALSRDLPGRVAPMRIADVRARVPGLVVKRTFEQGSLVKAGDLLYQIDPSLYEVEVASRDAAVARGEATLALARQQADRARELLTRQAASQAQFDTASASMKQAEADLAAAKAARDLARLNLSYTQVRAPISGRIGRALLTEGTLIEAGTAGGVLATIQQLDPVYVDVTQSVGELNRIRRDVASGQLDRLEGTAAAVQLIMEDGSLYGAEGHLLFSDVTADPSTGQVTLRIQVPNAADELFPGMYVRARIKEGVDSDAIVVPQQAVQRKGTGEAEVFVVRDGKAVLQPIDVDRIVGANWIVRRGLAPGDAVVVDGFQRISSGASVRVRETTPSRRDLAADATSSDKASPSKDQVR